MIDLKLNYPSIPAEEAALQDFLRTVLNRGELTTGSDYPDASNNWKPVRHWLHIDDSVYPAVSNIVACNSSNQALNILLQGLRKDHRRIVTEAFTYPAFLTLAGINGFELAPAAVDGEGVTPEGLERAVGSSGARLVYLQPTIHNPTCSVMSLKRREEIAVIVRRHQLVIIEDDAYRFLHPDPPPRFLDLLPENTIFIAGLSKPFNPLIKTSYIVFPQRFAASFSPLVRLNGGMRSTLLSGLAAHLLESGLMDTIIERKRAYAEDLQAQMLPVMQSLEMAYFPSSYHFWVTLPGGIGSSELVGQLAVKGIDLPRGAEYCGDNPALGERYLRIAMGSEREPANIKYGLSILMDTIGGGNR